MGNVRIPIISGGGSEINIIAEKIGFTSEYIVPLERNAAYTSNNEKLLYDLPQGMNHMNIKFCILEALAEIQSGTSGALFGMGIAAHNTTYNTSYCRIMTYAIQSGEQFLAPFITNFVPHSRGGGRCFVEQESPNILFNPSLQYQLRIYT